MTSYNTVYGNYDSNHDGAIDRTEFARMYTAAGAHLTQSSLDRQWNKFDSNHDGKITLNEFRQHVHLPGAPVGYRFTNRDAHVRHLFSTYDSDRDGFLNRDELNNFYISIGANLSQEQLDVQFKYIRPRVAG